MMQPPIELRKPETITLVPGEASIKSEKIIAIHDDPVTHATFHVILHGGVSFNIGKEHAAYPEVQALYEYRSFVWIEEDAKAITFFAHDANALAVLYEELERDNYHFTFHLGATDNNSIKVFRNQGEELEALDREVALSTLVDNFRTPLPEEEEAED